MSLRVQAVQTRRNASEGGAEADDEMAAASEATLPAVAQAILLAAAVTVRKSQADAGTRSWEMAPYHECVQSQMRSRPVLRAAAAVLSSRHERERPRTRERALLLMEDLVRGLDAKAPSAAARMRYAYSVWFPPGARLRKELGDQLVALGMVCGFSYARTRNLLTPMMIHSLWNSGVLVIVAALVSTGNADLIPGAGNTLGQ